MFPGSLILVVNLLTKNCYRVNHALGRAVYKNTLLLYENIEHHADFQKIGVFQTYFWKLLR